MIGLKRTAASALLLAGVSVTGCNTATGKGAAVGGAGGAVVGALTGNAAKGAVVGAAGGAVVGAIKDSNDKKRSCYYDGYGRKICPNR